MNPKVIYPILALLLLLNIGTYILHFGKPAPSLAYINSNILLSRYKGMAAASAEFKQKSTIWQANIDTLKKELENSIKKYQDEQATMGEKEKELNRQLIQSKQQQFQQYQESIQQKAVQEDQQITRKVLDEVNVFIKGYAEKKGYKMVWAATDVGNIVYAEEALDITEEALAGLNEAYDGK